MRIHLLPVLLALSTAACDEGSKCPSSPAHGAPCSGSVTCSYAGCANPGDTCTCRNGQWSCLITTCKLPDRGVDAIAVDVRRAEARAGDAAQKDARPRDAAPREAGLPEGAPCLTGNDKCGPGLKCCVTCCGIPPIGDMAVNTTTCVKPMASGECPPPPP